MCLSRYLEPVQAKADYPESQVSGELRKGVPQKLRILQGGSREAKDGSQMSQEFLKIGAVATQELNQGRGD
jgi:hypothetical protein